MTDYGYLFATSLHTKLKEKITGKIFVIATKEEDALFVKIESYGDITYKYYLDNFSDRILNGLSSDYVAYEVVKDFKGFILSKYLH
jgi:hypothetical protein